MSCIVVGCYNTSVKRIKGITFHRFPKSDEFRQSWIDAVARKDWLPSKTSVICSAHFEEDCFYSSASNRIMMKKLAVPSIFPSSSHTTEISNENKLSSPLFDTILIQEPLGMTSELPDINLVKAEEDSMDVPIATSAHQTVNVLHIKQGTTIDEAVERNQNYLLTVKLKKAEEKLKLYRKKIHSLESHRRKVHRKNSYLKVLVMELIRKIKSEGKNHLSGL